ncbi:MAG: hypothetical protein Q8K72_01880, partial [Acidimicrobiales bacterium]|nr:hypothetical protein [Acidimicrobiales bacterium]
MATVPVCPPRLGALGDDDVTARLHGGDRVANLTAHVHHEHPAAVAELDDVTRHAQPGDEHGRATGDDRLDLLLEPRGERSQQVDPEGPLGAGADFGHLGLHAVEPHRRRAEGAEATSVADGRDQGGVRHAAHSGQHDGVIAVEDLGE